MRESDYINIPLEFLYLLNEIALDAMRLPPGEAGYWALEFPVSRRNGALKEISHIIEDTINERV